MYIMDKACTVYRTMDYLAKRWTMMIMLELYKGTDGGNEWKRFSTIRSSMAEITPKVLSERLKELESQGLIENRVDSSSFPVKSEYRLTEAGRELMIVVHDLKMWALKWKIDNEPCKNQDCRLCII
jgi:DNA-binding HxlR family transcriptional regulator